MNRRIIARAADLGSLEMGKRRAILDKFLEMKSIRVCYK